MKEPQLPPLAATRPLGSNGASKQSLIETGARPAPVDPNAILLRLDERMARMEARMNQLGELADQVPGLAEMGMDTFDEVAKQYGVHERTMAAVELLERVSRKETLERLTQAVEILDGLPGQVELALDALDEVAAKAESRGVDLSQLVPQSTELLTDFVVAHQRALNAPATEMGIMGLLRAAREPELRRALAFLVELGRGLGGQMKRQDGKGPAALPPAR